MTMRVKQPVGPRVIGTTNVEVRPLEEPPAPGRSSGWVAGTRRVNQPVSSPDLAFDGALIGSGPKPAAGSSRLEDVCAVQPAIGRAAEPGAAVVIFVNGVQNDVAEQVKALQIFADACGLPAVGVHNATARLAADVLESVADKIGFSNPATQTLSKVIADKLLRGEPVHLVAHSQGALIAAVAVSNTRARLLRANLKPAEIDARLAKLTIETFGGACASYPPGPRYIHYINTRDPVPLRVGLGGPRSGGDLLASDRDPPTGDMQELQRRAGGPGSVVHYIDDSRAEGMALENHYLREAYLPQRVSVADALVGKFNDVSTKPL